ncbi:MAG: hypothetical protein J5509_12520 [Lachnospiraceae bacterium]|nr:hypothetical protein [Lachnospiraceae bacterium]
MDLNVLQFRKVTDKAYSIDMIDDVMEAIKEEIEGKDLREFELREKLEPVYLDKINLQFQTARLFHPMSEFGRMVLKSALDTQKEYEDNVGALITLVTDDSIRKYKPLLTDDVMEDIMVGKTQAIAALRYRDGAVYAPGIIAYDVDTDRLQENIVVRIEWLYIAEEFRGEGIADMLLGNIIGRCIDLGIENITFDFPEESEYAQAYYNLLSDWHFSFTSGISSDFVTEVTKDTVKKNIVAMSYTAQAIEELSEKEFMDVAKKLLSDGTLDTMLKGEFPPDYFDPKLSCVARRDSMTGMLLAHRLPSGLVRTEYLGWGEGSGPALKGLVSFLAVKALEVYGKGTMISVPVESDELAAFIDETFEVQLRKPMIEASLFAPLPEEDVDLEMAAAILTVPGGPEESEE